eukprot:scaffold8160_cov126-Isochrysis_galbana.AAC.5
MEPSASGVGSRGAGCVGEPGGTGGCGMRRFDGGPLGRERAGRTPPARGGCHLLLAAAAHAGHRRDGRRHRRLRLADKVSPRARQHTVAGVMCGVGGWSWLEAGLRGVDCPAAKASLGASL